MTPEDVIDRVAADGVALTRFLYCDNANIVRGKAAVAAALPDFITSGIGLTVAMQAFTLTERIADASPLGPVGEVRLAPDPDTYVPLPYAPRQAAMLCDMLTLDGQPWQLCPRSLLKRTLARVAAAGFEAQAGFEHEFYLARPHEGGFLPLDDSLCFSDDGMNSAAPVILAIIDALQAQGLRPVQYYPELGPGQQELSLHHAPALRAVDNDIIARQTVRGVARAHGLVASYAPKPFPNQAGSGHHVHLSLWRDGRNSFYDAGDRYCLSATAYSFIAGILTHLPGLIALLAPSLNSYRRLAPGMWSSAYACYGPDNREAAVRIASPFRGREEGSANIELKALDASANPYIALSGILAAGLDGVVRGLQPGEPVTVNPGQLSDQERQQRGIRPFPQTLPDACRAFEADAVLVEALGPELAQEFVRIRHSEWSDLHELSENQETLAHFARY